ncbi:NUDIX domain-containing protein [Inquilinus limosus]|uniref:NUDIX hydrolase n=1 Tax=Inquilinus limosus TaxID=171674 RepID=UPI003F18E51F
MKHIACAILLRDDHILLGRRAPQRRFYPDCWDVLGGHLESGETPEQALIREVQEEAGVTPLHHRLIATLADPDPTRNGEALCHIFVVTGWAGGEPQVLGDEHSEIRWMPIAEAALLPDLAIEDYRDIFRSLASAS